MSRPALRLLTVAGAVTAAVCLSAVPALGGAGLLAGLAGLVLGLAALRRRTTVGEPTEDAVSSGAK